MSEVNFGAGATPVTEETNPLTEPQQQANTNTAVERPLPPDFVPSFRDVILPSLLIAHPVGDLGKAHPHGAIVYDQRLVLFRPAVFDAAAGVIKEKGTGPFNVTFFAFETPVFTEKVAGGKRGITVRTEQQVTSAGGTLDYQEWELKKSSGMKLFVPLTRAMVAVERPEHIADDDRVFVHKVNDKKYTLAFWSFKAGAYTAALKRVIFPAKLSGCLMKGYPTFNFSASAKLTPYSTGTEAWMPQLVANAPSTPEMLAFVTQVLKG